MTKYGREAGILRRPPGWKSEADVAAGAPRSSKSCCEPHRAFIEAAVGNGRHGVSIYQALVEHHGYTDSYDAVKRFIRPLRATAPKISARFETLPGQEAQVDYGEGAPARDPRTGKYRKPRLFVMTLARVVTHFVRLKRAREQRTVVKPYDMPRFSVCIYYRTLPTSAETLDEAFLGFVSERLGGD